jgi:hypothetical protein
MKLKSVMVVKLLLVKAEQPDEGKETFPPMDLLCKVLFTY